MFFREGASHKSSWCCSRRRAATRWTQKSKQSRLCRWVGCACLPCSGTDLWSAEASCWLCCSWHRSCHFVEVTPRLHFSISPRNMLASLHVPLAHLINGHKHVTNVRLNIEGESLFYRPIYQAPSKPCPRGKRAVYLWAILIDVGFCFITEAPKFPLWLNG